MSFVKNPILSIEIRAIYDHLRQANGELIAYCTLSALVGRDVQKEARHSMERARKKLFREEGIYFVAEHGVGLRRCDDTAKVDVGKSYVSKVKRSVDKGRRVTASINDYAALDKVKQVEHNATLSMLGAVSAMMTPQKYKTLKSNVEKAQAQLPLAKTLEALK